MAVGTRERALPFTAPALLAPMEGVTEPCFRDLVLARNDPNHLGGAFTEFLRVVSAPLPARVIRTHLGPRRFATPVGIQLMGSDPDAMAETARRAAEAGAPLVDLNFGCPAKGAIAGCAGSALLRDPRALEAIVAACTRAARQVPISAKIRAGYDHDRDIEVLARAAEAGGAAMLTVHCRTRAEGFQEEVDWGRISRAVASVAIPVCGNGGIRAPADFERMRAETGCALAMAGHAALANPWVFGGRQVRASDAARFLLDYRDELALRAGVSLAGSAGRVKQLLRHWTAGGLVDRGRETWIRERDPVRLFDRLAAIAGPARDEDLNPCLADACDPRTPPPVTEGATRRELARASPIPSWSPRP